MNSFALVLTLAVLVATTSSSAVGAGAANFVTGGYTRDFKAPFLGDAVLRLQVL